MLFSKIFGRERIFRDKKTREPFVASPRGLLRVTEARARELEGLPPVKPSTQPTAKAPAAPRPPAKPTATAPRPTTAKPTAPSVNDMVECLCQQKGLTPEQAMRQVAMEHPAAFRAAYGHLPTHPQTPPPEPEQSPDIWGLIQARMDGGMSLIQASAAVMALHPEAYDIFRRGGKTA